MPNQDDLLRKPESAFACPLLPSVLHYSRSGIPGEGVGRLAVHLICTYAMTFGAA
jgi:hypothetical protein